MKKLQKTMYVLVGMIMTFVLLIAPTQVQAHPISTCGYYDPAPLSFYGSFSGTSIHYDGQYMAVEAAATAEDGVSRELILKVYVGYTNTTHTYRIYSDGVRRKADYIPIKGGSDVCINGYYANSTTKVTIDLKMYSWQ